MPYRVSRLLMNKHIYLVIHSTCNALFNLFAEMSRGPET